jgi:hypothetical protein
MKRVTETFVLPCTPERFWRVFLDPAYVRSLYFDGLGFTSFEVLETLESSRKLRIVPKLNLPAVLAKLIGDSFAYEEHGSLDRARGEWTWKMVQPASTVGKSGALRDIVATRGSSRVEDAGDGRCRRHDELVIEARLFGLGGLIESSAEKEARSAWSKELPFFTRWVAEHPDA